ncbi:hypothetical protein LOTGIDRAFT_165004 [Lottia gigantea]|uniref:Glycosyltransferase 61 catalytic domain-containing protein n=1 Tax=Lottia gigantea TaxID=225164 RepID=V4BLC1_LOTGI|nr:hypothetical protein LOTGIDRAFT_165004 [Lottia gigantea]ESO89409.1 hypothetical protein LOTGIDRAFT_165004 [Lottia gigantea]
MGVNFLKLELSELFGQGPQDALRIFFSAKTFNLLVRLDFQAWMLRVRARGSHSRRYFWMCKQVWKYVIIMYLAFTCFYLYNMAIAPAEPKVKPRRGKGKHGNIKVTLPPMMPKDPEEDKNDFLKMFPDPQLNINPQQLRRRRQQMRELQNANLEKKRRQQIENEHKFEEKARQLKFQDRIQLLEYLKAYQFPTPKTRKRVELISKIRWRMMSQESVSMNYFGEDPDPPYDINDHYQKLRRVLNTKQSLELSYKPFTLVRPAFAVDKDRKIFLRNRENEEAMRTRQDNQFVGFIDAYKDGLVSAQIDCDFKNQRRLFIEYTADEDDVRVLGKTVCPLLIPKSDEFQGFITSVLPKIIQAYDVILASDVYLLIFEPRDSNILLLLDRLGIDRDRLIFHKKGLWKIKTVIDTCITPPLHPALFKTARRAMGTHENRTVPINEANVILLLREDTEEGGRKMVNKAEVTGNLFNRYGSHLKLVRQTATISESVDIFKNAKIVIGVHGGALYNILFAPSNTYVVEIMPIDKNGNVCEATGKLAHQTFWSLAAMLGQKYWMLVEEPRRENCNVKVDIEKLLKVLDKIDERHKYHEEGL